MSLRRRVGALIHDWPRYRQVRASGHWELMHNRDETVTADGRGVFCPWEFTSDLHIANVFPSTGAALMRMALSQWPVVMRDAPEAAEEPVVSFVIGHRGVSRLQHLLMTLRSIAGQSGVAIECIVIEQDRERLIESRLPPWVRYTFTCSDTDYNRSATLNEGVGRARGEIVILHDGDTLVPSRYAYEVLAHAREGAEFVDLKRFVFYLRPDETERLFGSGEPPVAVPSTVTQNGKGVSIAASKRAYIDIGGYDDEFVGWGGEDNDFWDRARAHGNVYEFGYLPMIHLHHEAQKGKGERAAPAVKRYYDIRSIPPEERITRLRERWRERAR
jgi:hypothetical protein